MGHGGGGCHGSRLARSRLRLLIVAGEGGGSIPATRARIERLWPGAVVFDHHGMTEVGPVTYQCPARPGALHVLESAYLPEVLDPQSGKPVPAGETGELVLTTLAKEAFPVIRYRTGDICSITDEPCACGRTTRRISRISGRCDDVVVVKGINIIPDPIERVLMSIPQIGRNYQIHLEGLDDMTVKVELSPAGFDGQIGHLTELQNQVVEKLRAELLVRPKVELVACGSLPVSEGKAKRVIDKRSL